MRRPLLLLLLFVGLWLPFLGKPVHIDDTNFLVLARGAVEDPWRPHAALINWQGHTERAFDVLSNPPGVGWWLAPLVALDAPVPLLHAWMGLWLPVALWGARALGARFADRPDAAALLLVGSPIALLAAQSLTPDLPLLACTLAGMGGLVRAGGRLHQRWPWALLLGAAALFRYSGVALLPLVVLWAALHRDVRAAGVLGLAAATPLGLLLAHDLHAYGELHLLAMTGFQGVSEDKRDVFRKGVAALAMLGGAGVLPLLGLTRRGAGAGARLGALLGALLGLGATALSFETWSVDHRLAAGLATVLATAAGGATLGACLPDRSREQRFLALWLALGLAFFLELRFMAARYWLPFFAPAALIPLRATPPRLLALAVVITPALGLLLAIDDQRLAVAQQELARRVASEGRGLFAGHWGWQSELEAAGWTALEEDAPIPPGVLFARSTVSWPQEPAGGCLQRIETLEAPAAGWGPRIHSAEGAANLHAFVVAGDPVIETYAPWTFARDPYDRVTLDRGCEGVDGREGAGR